MNGGFSQSVRVQAKRLAEFGIVVSDRDPLPAVSGGGEERRVSADATGARDGGCFSPARHLFPEARP